MNGLETPDLLRRPAASDLLRQLHIRALLAYSSNTANRTPRSAPTISFCLPSDGLPISGSSPKVVTVQESNDSSH